MKARAAFVALFACIAASAQALPANAQERQARPAFSEKSAALEIEIAIDDRLRADPRLYETIEGEAERLIAERQAEADAEWREDPTMFRHGPWSFERSYRFTAEAGPYISALVIDYVYTGGAHPNNYGRTILWNREAGRRAEIAELLREAKSGGPTLTALAALIRDAVAEEKRARGIDVEEKPETDQWLSSIKPDFETLGAPGLVASTETGKAAGLSFRFSPYDVGPYAEGSYLAVVPWRALEPYLTGEARAWFGGEPAAEAADE